MKKSVLSIIIILVSVVVGGVLGWLKYNEKRPLVSVILPTYNRASMLPRAVDSILNQTMEDFEFIIINDGSQDRTQEILEEYAAKDRRIKIIKHRKNQGLIASLNDGLDKARGKYIARMDDDDEAFRERFAEQVAFLENKQDITGVGTWASPIGSVNAYNYWQQIDPDYVKIDLLLGINDIAHSALMVRREFLNDNRIRYNKKYVAAEDRPFYADIMFAGGKLVNIPQVLMHIRIHGENSQEYYSAQRENMFRFQQDFMERYFDIHLQEAPNPCDLLFMLLKANQEKQLLNQEKLLRVDAVMCGGLIAQRFYLTRPR